VEEGRWCSADSGVGTGARGVGIDAALPEGWVDADCAHNLVEVTAALLSARQVAPGGRVLAVFQPSMYLEVGEALLRTCGLAAGTGDGRVQQGSLKAWHSRGERQMDPAFAEESLCGSRLLA
jgi:hypothetical protein